MIFVVTRWWIFCFIKYTISKCHHRHNTMLTFLTDIKTQTHTNTDLKLQESYFKDLKYSFLLFKNRRRRKQIFKERIVLLLFNPIPSAIRQHPSIRIHSRRRSIILSVDIHCEQMHMYICVYIPLLYIT